MSIYGKLRDTRIFQPRDRILYGLDPWVSIHRGEKNKLCESIHTFAAMRL